MIVIRFLFFYQTQNFDMHLINTETSIINFFVNSGLMKTKDPL